MCGGGGGGGKKKKKKKKSTLPGGVVGCASVAVRPETVGSDFQPEDLEQYRRELTGYCYRMLGSSFEADDAVQETMVRAWRGSTASRGDRRCAHGCTASPPTCVSTCSGAASAGPAPWRWGRRRPPTPPTSVRCSPRTLDDAGSRLPGPADQRRPGRGGRGEGEHPAGLRRRPAAPPARQRAVLILREVLRWQATEVAELLDTTVASVNSALQRARATLADRTSAPADPDASTPTRRSCSPATSTPSSATTSSGWSPCSTTTPSSRCRPTPCGCRGGDQIGRWMLGAGIGCQGSRLLPTRPTGAPPSGSTGSTRTGARALGAPGHRDLRTAGSPGSTPSSTPTSSLSSASPPTSTTSSLGAGRRIHRRQAATSSSSSHELTPVPAQPHRAAETANGQPEPAELVDGRQIGRRPTLERPAGHLGVTADDHDGRRRSGRGTPIGRRRAQNSSSCRPGGRVASQPWRPGMPSEPAATCAPTRTGRSRPATWIGSSRREGVRRRHPTARSGTSWP